MTLLTITTPQLSQMLSPLAAQHAGRAGAPSGITNPHSPLPGRPSYMPGLAQDALMRSGVEYLANVAALANGAREGGVGFSPQMGTRLANHAAALGALLKSADVLEEGTPGARGTEEYAALREAALKVVAKSYAGATGDYDSTIHGSRTLADALTKAEKAVAAYVDKAGDGVVKQIFSAVVLPSVTQRIEAHFPQMFEDGKWVGTESLDVNAFLHSQSSDGTLETFLRGMGQGGREQITAILEALKLPDYVKGPAGPNDPGIGPAGPDDGVPGAGLEPDMGGGNHAGGSIHNAPVTVTVSGHDAHHICESGAMKDAIAALDRSAAREHEIAKSLLDALINLQRNYGGVRNVTTETRTEHTTSRDAQNSGTGVADHMVKLLNDLQSTGFQTEVTGGRASDGIDYQGNGSGDVESNHAVPPSNFAFFESSTGDDTRPIPGDVIAPPEGFVDPAAARANMLDAATSMDDVESTANSWQTSAGPNGSSALDGRDELTGVGADRRQKIIDTAWGARTQGLVQNQFSTKDMESHEALMAELKQRTLDAKVNLKPVPGNAAFDARGGVVGSGELTDTQESGAQHRGAHSTGTGTISTGVEDRISNTGPGGARGNEVSSPVVIARIPAAGSSQAGPMHYNHATRNGFERGSSSPSLSPSGLPLGTSPLMKAAGSGAHSMTSSAPAPSAGSTTQNTGGGLPGMASPNTFVGAPNASDAVGGARSDGGELESALTLASEKIAGEFEARRNAAAPAGTTGGNAGAAEATARGTGSGSVSAPDRSGNKVFVPPTWYVNGDQSGADTSGNAGTAAQADGSPASLGRLASGNLQNGPIAALQEGDVAAAQATDRSATITTGGNDRPTLALNTALGNSRRNEVYTPVDIPRVPAFNAGQIGPMHNTKTTRGDGLGNVPSSPSVTPSGSPFGTTVAHPGSTPKMNAHGTRTRSDESSSARVTTHGAVSAGGGPGASMSAPGFLSTPEHTASQAAKPSGTTGVTAGHSAAKLISSNFGSLASASPDSPRYGSGAMDPSDLPAARPDMGRSTPRYGGGPGVPSSSLNGGTARPTENAAAASLVEAKIAAVNAADYSALSSYSGLLREGQRLHKVHTAPERSIADVGDHLVGDWYRMKDHDNRLISKTTVDGKDHYHELISIETRR